MGYNLRDRSAIKRKLTPELEPEVKKPAAKRQRTARPSVKKGNKKVDVDESLPSPGTETAKKKVSRPKKTSISVIEVQPKGKVRKKTTYDRASSPRADPICIRSSSPVDEAAGEIGPVERVFHTAELLEIILLNVYDGDDSVISSTAMKTVLLSQRVNSFFKATIDGSAKLERALWLLPDEEVSNSFAGTMQVRLNPLLRANLRHNRRPFAEASVTQHSNGAFIKVLCTVEGFFGEGCESAKSMMLARTARQEYTCEITFRLPGGAVPMHPDFAVRCPRDMTVGELEDDVFKAMFPLVHGTGNQKFDVFLARPRWFTALESAKTLRAARGRSVSEQ